MLLIIEKLQSLMNGYTKAMQDIKDFALKNTNVYAAEELNRLSDGKKKEIKTSYQQQAGELVKEFESTLSNLRLDLRSKKYPNLSNSDSALKTTAEFQLTDARQLLATNDKNKVLKGLENGFYLDRIDFVSSVLDQIDLNEVKNTDMTFYNQLEDLKQKLISKVGADNLVKEILSADENSQINKIFLDRVTKGNEFIPYPLTMDYIKSMPKNVVSVDMDRINQSLEMRASINPSMV